MLDISPETLPVDMFVSSRIFGGDTNVGITGKEVEVKSIYVLSDSLLKSEKIMFAT